MLLEENKDGTLFAFLTEKDIIRALYLHYNFPRSSKMEIVITPDKKDTLSAVIKIP